MDFLKLFEKLGLIYNALFKSWETLLDKDGIVDGGKMIKLEATDAPNLTRECSG